MTQESVGDRVRVLHVILMLGETNSQYNEHCLPMIGVRDLSICTYFEPRLSPPPQIQVFSGDGSLRGFLRAFRAALDAGPYDVIHAHSPQAGVLVPAALLTQGRFRRLRRSLAYTVHDSFYDYKLRDQALMVLAMAAFPRIVFCSRAAYSSLPTPWKLQVGRRWRVIQNGADLDRVDRVLAGSAIPPTDGFTVLSIGRLERVKDPSTLAAAFGRTAEAEDRLVFVGAGDQLGAVAARARELGLGDRVLFTGLIPRDEVFVRCAGADLFVSTSRGEGLPVAVMEAMAAGCPAILSDIPPHRELVDGASFIPLVPPGDVGGFAREIRRVRQMTANERRELGHRCRDHVVERFSLPAMHAGYEDLYREISARHLVGMTTP